MKLGRFTLVYLVTQLGCTELNDRNNAQDYLSDVYPKKGDLVMVTIPTSGCIGCIKPAIEFLKGNIQDTLDQFVLTEVNDAKLTRSWLGESLYSNPRLIIDSNNLWRRYNLAGSYPLIIVRKNGKVTLVKKVLPEEKNIWIYLSQQ